MRLSIHPRMNASAPYEMRLPNCAIAITRPLVPSRLTHAELWWNWLDGEVYKLLAPLSLRDSQASWQLRRGDSCLCVGRAAHPFIRCPSITWNYETEEYHSVDHQRIVSQLGPCKKDVVDGSGHRLAVVTSGARAWNVVIRPNVEGVLLGICIGIVIAVCCFE
jgi:hypothetical protein